MVVRGTAGPEVGAGVAAAAAAAELLPGQPLIEAAQLVIVTSSVL